MSHPFCFGDSGSYVLQRFEELVLHEGRHVFLPLDEDAPADALCPTPARQFHTVHDAAAWIQKNWPDFDLETNHPVTWRPSR